MGEYLLREVRTSHGFSKATARTRVAAVAVTSALVVFGLEAPASATSPTISSFSPTAARRGAWW